MEITKMSSKGQIVLPIGIRESLGLKEGSVFATIKDNDLIILKKIDNVILEEDIKTIKRVEEAWKDIEEGRFKEMESDDFLKELKKW